MSIQVISQNDTRELRPLIVAAREPRAGEVQPALVPTGVTYGSLLQQACCWPDAL